MNVPLLRAPPFPGIDASVTQPGTGTALAPGAIDALFAAIREAQVGGSFWCGPYDGAIRSEPNRSPAKAGVQSRTRDVRGSGPLPSQGNSRSMAAGLL